MNARSLSWIAVIIVCSICKLFAEIPSTNTTSFNAPETYEIKSYSPQKGVVGIKTSTGVTNLPFSAFTATQQQDIVAWRIDKQFQSSGLRVTIETTKDKQNITTYDPQYTWQEGTREIVSYAISVDNQTEVEFDEITIDSRIFYATEDGNIKGLRCVIGTETFNLAPKHSKLIKTSVALRDENTFKGLRVENGVIIPPAEKREYNKDRLIGLYVCARKKDRNGQLMLIEEKDGNVPKKETWEKYKEAPSPAQSIE